MVNRYVDGWRTAVKRKPAGFGVNQGENKFPVAVTENLCAILRSILRYVFLKEQLAVFLAILGDDAFQVLIVFNDVETD